MENFSEVIRNELMRQKMSVATFAKKMEFSIQYTYNLINRKGDKRWNEDSMQRACEVLGIEIKFDKKSV